MAPQLDLKLPYIAQYLRKNPIYILHNLLDLCRCLKIHLKTTHTRLLNQKSSTLHAANMRESPVQMRSNLLNLCRCLEILLRTTHICLLSRKPSTLLVATKMALRWPRGTAAVQAGTLMSAATAGPRKLVMRVYHLNHISSEQSTIVPGTDAVLPQLHL